MIKYNLYPNFENMREADIFVKSSGLISWDWNTPEMQNFEVADLLSKFLYRKADGVTSLEDLLSVFIKRELRLRPRDFSLNDVYEPGEEF